jgi:hypothetical protein
MHTRELKEVVESVSRDWWRALIGRPRPRLLVRTAAGGLTRDPHARMHGWLGWVTNDGALLMLDLVRATEHHLARHHRLPETLGLSDDTFFRWEPCAGLVRTGASPGRVLAHEICHVLAPLHHRPPDDPRDIALTAAVRDLAELEDCTGELESLFAQGLKSGAVFRTESGSERVILPATLGLNEGLTELLAIRFIQEAATDSPSVLWDRDGFARWGGRIEDGAYRHESAFVADVLGEEDPGTFAKGPRATERFSALACASLAPSDRCRFDAWLRAPEEQQLALLAGPHLRAGLRLFGRVSARSAQIWRERMRHADAIERADTAVSVLRAQLAAHVTCPAPSPPASVVTRLAAEIASDDLRAALEEHAKDCAGRSRGSSGEIDRTYLAALDSSVRPRRGLDD